MEESKQQHFKRQITLAEIGEKGQQKILDAKVLVIGCGGLGSPIAVALAASGVGTLHLIDFDTIEQSNLHRQTYFTLSSIGQSKAETLARYLHKIAPFTQVTYQTEAVSKENVLSCIGPYDVIVEGTDSLPTKYLVNDACVLTGKPLVYGSLFKFDGYVSTFNILEEHGGYSANLRDAFAEMATDIPTCEEAGTLNPIVGMIAMLQVNEVLKMITGTGTLLRNQLLIYNALQNTQIKMKLQSQYSKKEITAIFERETYFDPACTIQRVEWCISVAALREKLANEHEAQKLEIIAVLPDLDVPFGVHRTIPIQELVPEEISLDTAKTYVMVCRRGNTSYQATALLKAQYPEMTIFSLSGGITEYI